MVRGMVVVMMKVMKILLVVSDSETIVDCDDDVDGDSGDKNNGDGVDDGGVNINGDDDGN